MLLFYSKSLQVKYFVKPVYILQLHMQLRMRLECQMAERHEYSIAGSYVYHFSRSQVDEHGCVRTHPMSTILPLPGYYVEHWSHPDTSAVNNAHGHQSSTIPADSSHRISSTSSIPKTSFTPSFKAAIPG